MSKNSKGWPWEVELEAMPKNDGIIDRKSERVTVEAINRTAAIAAARKRIITRFNLGKKYIIKTISCNEQKK